MIDYYENIFQFDLCLLIKIDKMFDEIANLKKELESMKRTPTYADMVSSASPVSTKSSHQGS